MQFNTTLPEWKNEGAEPSDELKENGYQGGQRPPAAVFNWFWSKVCKAISEIQSKLSSVDNTADSEKNVAFASEAGVGRKVANKLTVRFKGGSTEGTDMFTYDGSTGKSVNITPANIKAAEKDHSHSPVDVKKVVTATSNDGVAYTATVDGVIELYAGLEITIIPNMKSTSKAITLDVNGLGAKPVRQPLSFSTFVATAPNTEGFMYANTPCRLMFHAEYVSGGIWLMADKQKTSAQDLYGDVPIESGGTGASTAEAARANLGAASKEELDKLQKYYSFVTKDSLLGGVDYGSSVGYGDASMLNALSKYKTAYVRVGGQYVLCSISFSPTKRGGDNDYYLVSGCAVNCYFDAWSEDAPQHPKLTIVDIRIAPVSSGACTIYNFSKEVGYSNGSIDGIALYGMAFPEATKW